MKVSVEDGTNDRLSTSAQSMKVKRNKLGDHELEELREHIDLISFNIGKVYQHAKDRSRKEYKKTKHTLNRKLHHSYKNEKIRI